ncbi:MAG TPA: hypothetical protein PKA53_08630, partial [Sphingobacterium sp.]|nr:hypothetical protein [Sphingobacterium sp.]
KYDVTKVYAAILKEYLKKFCLEPIDVAFLIATKRDVIDGLLTGKRGVVLKTLDKISQLFGLTYYEFGNPNHPIPAFDSLPERTRKRIAYREQVGPHKEETYNSLDLNEKITIALSLFKENDKFLIEELVDIINDKSGDKTHTSLIGDRLSKSFVTYVAKTDIKGKSKSGRGRRPYYFKLIKKLPKEMVAIAKEIVGDKWPDA